MKRKLRATSSLLLVTFTALCLQPTFAEQPRAMSVGIEMTARPTPRILAPADQLRSALREYSGAHDEPTRLDAYRKITQAVESLISQAAITTLSASEASQNSALKSTNLGDSRLAAMTNQVREREAEFTSVLEQMRAAAAGDELNRQQAVQRVLALSERYLSSRGSQAPKMNQLPWRPSVATERQPTGRMTKVQLAAARAKAQAAPAASDLAQTEDVILSNAVQSKAAELGHNPVALYTWVKNSVEYVPTYGSVQGSDLTLAAGRGNAFDISSLLIALLRASNIPARYVVGTIEVPASAAVKWLGTASANSALSLLAQAGVPSQAVVSGGQIATIRLDHVWVEAYVGVYPGRGARAAAPSGWVELDASIKTHEKTAGLPIKQAISFDTSGLLSALESGATIDSTTGQYTNLNASAYQESLLAYSDSVTKYLATAATTSDPFNAVGIERIVAQTLPVLPLTTPHPVIARSAVYSDLPAELRASVKISFFASNDQLVADLADQQLEVSLPKIGKHRLGVTFLPESPSDAQALATATADDAAKSLPAYLIRLKPEIQLDGVPLKDGTAATMGAQQAWRLEIRRPGDPAVDSHVFNTLAGDEMVFSVIGNGMNPQVASDRFLSPSPGAAAENLFLTSLAYWSEQDLLARLQARNMGVRYSLKTAFALFSSPLQVVSASLGVTQGVAYIGRKVDVAHLLFEAASDGDQANVDFGRTLSVQTSYLEGAVPEQLFGRPRGQGVSAVRLLEAANDQQIPILTIDKSNASAQLTKLSLGPVTSALIQDSVNAGKTVMLPQSAPRVNGFSGVGLIIEDPTTGAGAYLLEDLSNGGMLPDCACERVTQPKVQAMKDILLTLLVLGLLAALIAETGGIGAAGVPAALKALMLSLGMTALALPISASASSQVPPACCMTASCEKPVLYRGGNASSAQLEKIRLNRSGRQDDVDYILLDPNAIVPTGITCALIDPILASNITVIANGKGSSLTEDRTGFDPPVWRLPKDTQVPGSLCLNNDHDDHWRLAPRSNMTYSDLCQQMTTANGLFIRDH